MPRTPSSSNSPIGLQNVVLLSLSGLLLASTGCADPTGRPFEQGIGGLTTMGMEEGDEGQDAETSAGETDDDDDNQSSGVPLYDLGEQPDLPQQEECASVQVNAAAKKLPADIIVVVDNSGSMTAEAGQVQQRLNNFSQQIIDSGVDVRVTLISSYPGNGNGICIAAPLGSGGCPSQDTNQPVFLHINQFVASHDALQQTLARANQWMPTTRPDAVTHLLVVTDDESNLGPNNFLNAFHALSPDFDDLRVHGVVSMHNCSYAADIGDTYIDLADMTDGVIADLCDQDFGPVFDALSTEVIGGSLLPCEFEIPPPPEGEIFDPEAVNVEFNDGVNNYAIGKVADASECGNVEDGWYYDDPANPTAIVMCGQTCGKFQDLEQAELEILFGCATIPAG